MSATAPTGAPAPTSSNVELFVISYNGGPELLKTLDSVLAQTCARKKVILSDNGSKDGSVALARPLEARGLELRVRSPGTGDCYSHYNACIPEITAPYAAIFHGGDVYDPTMVEKQLALLEANPGLDAVLTGGTAIDEKDRTLWPLRLPPGLRHPVLDPKQVFEYTLTKGSGFLLAPSALFRSSVFKRLGPFRAELPYCADMEYWLRCLLRGGGLGYLDEPLLRYRLSVGQGSNIYDKIRLDESEFFRVLTAYEKEFPVGPETRQAFEALRHLDLFQAGLNRLAKKGEAAMLLENLRWLDAPERKRFLGNFGALDRLKLLGARAVAPVADSPVGPALARLLIRQTDPWTSTPLRLAIKARRMIRRGGAA